jgi:hypothetical protein
MRKFLVALSMATLLAATAISAFCTNSAEAASGPYRQPLYGPQFSLSNPPLQVLVQAGSIDTNPLVSDGLLKPVAGSADPDAVGATSADKPKSTPTPVRTPVPGCKNGQAVGNKHCVPSPSE